MEMMIGVICTCAPSFSKIVQEHISSFETLKSSLQSSFRTISHSISEGSTKLSSRYRRGEPKQHSGDHISYKERLTRSRIAGDRGYEVHDSNSLQAFVGEVLRGFATEDGVHLKSEILQERAAVDGLYWENKRKWPPFTAVREANMV